MKKDQEIRSKKRSDGGAVARESDKTFYTCGAEGCRTADPAATMFNLPCNPGEISFEELQTKIRCAPCAEAMASASGKRPGERGSSFYHLERTLRIMDKLGKVRQEREQEATEYVKWILKGQKERAIRRYAERYALLPPYSDPVSPSRLGVTLPKPILTPDGHHRCGLPLECCRHSRPAARYLMVLGEVVGICHMASRVFLSVFKENDGDRRYRRLLSTNSIETVKSIAARWLGSGDDTRKE